MARQTQADIGSVLVNWKKIAPETVSTYNQLYLISISKRQNIEIREALTQTLVPRHRIGESPEIILACPFCYRALELRLYVDDFVKCSWNNCNAYICIRIDISVQTYVPYAIAKMPQ